MKNRLPQAKHIQMERRTLIIIGFLLCIIAIFIMPLLYKNMHYGEIFMLLIIYTIPALVLATLNGYLLQLITLKAQNMALKIGVGFLPLLIMLLLGIGRESPIQFIATFGLIGIGITNLFWMNTLVKSHWQHSEK